ncbi:hypothetical protein L2E82_51248 [Cichorium intybus]|nr:hypothetical protein L2E82_51248 [Cichorium intybus]
MVLENRSKVDEKVKMGLDEIGVVSVVLEVQMGSKFRGSDVSTIEVMGVVFMGSSKGVEVSGAKDGMASDEHGMLLGGDYVGLGV